MTPVTMLRSLAAGALVAGASLSMAPAAVAAPAELSGTVKFNCTMPAFGSSADFVYDSDLSIKGIREAAGSSPVTLVAEMSPLPGVVPAFLSLKDQKVILSLNVDAAGKPTALTVTGKTDVNPSNNGTKEPVVLPKGIQGTVATTDADVSVTVKSFDFNVADVEGKCTAATGGSLGTLTPELGVAPTPTPTPTPSPTPTPAPTKAPKPPKTDSKGKAASGTISLKCQMKGTFTKAYDYKVKVTVAGARAEEGSSKVTIAADFGDIPGLAPVPITNGNMRVTSKLSLDGTEVEVKGSSSVNAAASQPVPVPRLTGTGTVEGDSAKVEVKTFNFEFDKISGADVAADCTSDNGTVGTMAMGVGDIDDVEPPKDGGNGGTGSTGGGTTTLPQTGGGDAMPVIGLWALALGVIGAGLLVWMPRQRRSTI